MAKKFPATNLNLCGVYLTNSEGIYNFNSLPPGPYTLRVASPGFSPYEKTEVALAAGPRTTHDVRLVVTLENR